VKKVASYLIIFIEVFMPNYEFHCLDCRIKFEIFLSYADYGQKSVLCPSCQSSNVRRKIGRIRVAHSEENRLESMADPASLAGLEDDPRALGRMMKQMSSELGEDMGPEFKEVVGRLESGEAPDQIEKSMPDLGAESAGPEGSAPGMAGLDDF
jgi:putative FmdB family regulatory protein